MSTNEPAVQLTESDDDCQPLAPIPAWWSGFLFQVLNPRQVCMFVYLTMICDARGECQPTIEQIRDDLGLFSTSMVFEALSALEDLGLITRERRPFPGARAKRNVYRRPSCEATVLRLLERELIDGRLRPAGRADLPATSESRELATEGLKATLDSNYPLYEATPEDKKRDVLMEMLRTIIEEQGSA
jgi:DNA-binding PadR family transcriptional regulator